MNFRDAEEYLFSLGNEVSTMKLGLESIRKLLAALGDPHEKYLKVQVAGTNGKGSVCAFLNSICIEAGIRTGMYTSPHLVSITERVKINGLDVTKEDFADFATRVRKKSEALVADGHLENVPTFFEQMTAIALIVFAEAGVQLAILETGLGGRLDATTATNAEIAVITRIDLDHQKYLGETLGEIAAEKAAIIHKGSRACVGRQQKVALDVIKQRCAATGVRPKTLESARWVRNPPGYDFMLDGFQADEVVIALAGEHQIENAALAIIAAQELASFVAVSREQIIAGIENANHPGRLEWLELRGVQILLDGAHNPGGADALAGYLKGMSPRPTAALVYASMHDKDFKEILESLGPQVRDVILTQPNDPRAVPADELADAIREDIGPKRVYVLPSVRDALDTAIRVAGNYSGTRPSMVLVTGSLYLVGEVKRLLQDDPKFEI